MTFLVPLLLTPIFFFAFTSILHFVLFIVGVVLAIVLLWFDQSIGYKYYAEPGKAVQLITRSPLFFVAYILTTLYVVTSSGSPLGIGLVMGIGMVISAELFMWRNNPEVLNGRFYAHAAKQLSPNDFSWVFRGLVLFLLIMTAMLYV